MFELFFRNVTQRPQATAFILSDGSILTYREANNVVTKWVDYLQAIGIKQGDRVGVLTDENEDIHPFIHLALDKINTSYVPFDADVPLNQLTQDVKKLELKTLLIDQHLSEKFLASKEEHTDACLVLPKNGVLPDLKEEIPHAEVAEITRNPEIPNYIVASSGVSSLKKWIPILSSGLMYWAEVELPELGLKIGDKILCTRSPAYDARIFEYVLAFSSGGTLCLMTKTQRKDMNFLIKQCEQLEINSIILIASQLNTPNQEAMISRLSKSGLRYLMVTGEACSIRLQELCEHYHIDLLNCYGPTEATFGMSILRVNHLRCVDESGTRIVPIGSPKSDLVGYHLDEAGCLYIKSPFLSPGYWEDKTTTEKNFPILMINGVPTRVFNTENHFSVKEDGLLAFHGRIGESAHCKVSGEKVEAFPIEQHLLDYNRLCKQDVLQACVVIKKWQGQDKPVAYIVQNVPLNQEHFSEYLRNSLRPAEMPILLTIDSLPLLQPSQKINRQDLIKRDDTDTPLLFSTTQSGEEKSPIGKIWAEILGLTQVDPNQQFIFAGGDSMKLAAMIQRINNEITSNYSYKDLAALPSLTVNEIKKSLQQKIQIAGDTALVNELIEPDPNCKKIIWFLPPLLGEAYFTYIKLAQAFLSGFDFNGEHEFNIYGLSDPGIYDEKLAPNSLKEAAARYIKALKKIQPKGPYHLLGFSFGATLAYEVAKQLEELGNAVETLELVDAFPPILLQKISVLKHKELLEELVNFVIGILNNRYYGETLKKVKLTRFEIHGKEVQVETAFDLLKQKVKNPLSKAVLELAKKHLLMMLTPQTCIKKLAVNAKVNFTSRDQTYLNIIDSVPKIETTSPEYLFNFWNHYFYEVKRGAFRAKCKHLEVLKSHKELEMDSGYGYAPRFWNTAYDKLLHLQAAAFHPDSQYQVYHLEAIDDQHYFCSFLNLFWYHTFRDIRLQLGISAIDFFPFYESIYDRYEKDRQYIETERPYSKLYTQRFCMAFIISAKQHTELMKLLEHHKFKAIPQQISQCAVYPDYFKEQENSSDFTIRLTITQNRENLLTHYFKCHAPRHKVIIAIARQLQLVPTHDYDKNTTSFHYHYDYRTGVNKESKAALWAATFSALLLPYVLRAESQLQRIETPSESCSMKGGASFK